MQFATQLWERDFDGTHRTIREIRPNQWENYFSDPTPVLFICSGSKVASYPGNVASKKLKRAEGSIQLAEEVMGTYQDTSSPFRVAVLTWHSAEDNEKRLERIHREPELVTDEARYIAERMFSHLGCNVTLLGLSYGSIFAQELGIYFAQKGQSTARERFAVLGLSHIGRVETLRDAGLPGVYSIGNNDRVAANYTREHLRRDLKIWPEVEGRILKLSDTVGVFTSLIPFLTKRWMYDEGKIGARIYEDRAYHHFVGHIAAAPGSEAILRGAGIKSWKHSLVTREILFNLCKREGPLSLEEMLVVRDRGTLPFLGRATFPDGYPNIEKLVNEAKSRGFSL